MRLDETSDPAPGDNDYDYDRRRQHVLWYGGAVMLVLLTIIVLQVVT